MVGRLPIMGRSLEPSALDGGRDRADPRTGEGLVAAQNEIWLSQHWPWPAT